MPLTPKHLWPVPTLSHIRPSNVLPAAARLEAFSFAKHAARTYRQPIQCTSAYGPGVRGTVLILEGWVLEWVQATKDRNVQEETNVSIGWGRDSAGSRWTAVNSKHHTSSTTLNLRSQTTKQGHWMLNATTRTIAAAVATAQI